MPENNLPTHEEMIRLTRRLQRRLKGLLKDFPENDIEPGERIFPRLLTHEWRSFSDDPNGPHGRKYTEAARWVDDLYNYLKSLNEYCSCVLLKSELFGNLPINGHRKPPATECVRLLDLQVETLGNMKKQVPASKETANNWDQSELRERMRELVKAHGLPQVAAGARVNVDTLRDFLNRKANPRRKTLTNLRSYLSAINPTY
jgi:hypothetical protein